MTVIQASLLIGAVLPLLVSLITHAKASPAVKSGVLLVLTVVSSTITALADTRTWAQAGRIFEAQFAAAVVAHFGALAPLGLTGSTGRVSKAGLNLGEPLTLAS